MQGLIIVMVFSLISMMTGLQPLYASEPVHVSDSDVDVGKAFYAKKRCGMCHMIEGKGGKMGPDLSHIASKRDREWLIAFMKNPKKMVPGAKMMPVKGSDADLSALTTYLLSQQ